MNKLREKAILALMESKGFHRAPSESIVDCVLKSIGYAPQKERPPIVPLPKWLEELRKKEDN